MLCLLGNYHFVSPQEEQEEQIKADKIKLALEKLKEAKVKKVSDAVVLIFFFLSWMHVNGFKNIIQCISKTAGDKNVSHLTAKI